MKGGAHTAPPSRLLLIASEPGKASRSRVQVGGSKKAPPVEVLRPCEARLGAPGKRKREKHTVLESHIHYARYHPMCMRHAHPRGVNVERIIHFAFFARCMAREASGVLCYLYGIDKSACVRAIAMRQAPPLKTFVRG